MGCLLCRLEAPAPPAGPCLVSWLKSELVLALLCIWVSLSLLATFRIAFIRNSSTESGFTSSSLPSSLPKPSLQIQIKLHFFITSLALLTLDLTPMPLPSPHCSEGWKHFKFIPQNFTIIWGEFGEPLNLNAFQKSMGTNYVLITENYTKIDIL